jgi:multidrug transporter EmrE-like cation transporter
MPAGAQQQYSQKVNGLSPLKITGGKVITTSPGGGRRWVFLKVLTSEPGLYGIGSANNNYQTQAVITALEKHLIPWMTGKDPDRIEDLWNSANYRTYWRNGPINNQVLGALDEALWDITNATGVLSLEAGTWAATLVRMATQGYFMLGVLCYGVSLLVWILGLSRVPVSVAYPLLSIGYVVNAVAAHYLFGEGVNAVRWAGIGFIILGVWLVTRSAT